MARSFFQRLFICGILFVIWIWIYMNDFNLKQKLPSIYLISSTKLPKVDKPNILLIFPDQLRFDWIDNYYHSDLLLYTRTIEDIILSGTRFINVAVASPTCVPSRGTLASGMEYDNIAEMNNNAKDWPLNRDSFYSLMRDNGYWTMISGKDDLTKSHGVDIDGNYRINDIGFNDQRRCKGKLDINKQYPIISDPYSQYLSQKYLIQNNTNITFFDIIHQCLSKCDRMQQYCSEPCDLYDDESYQDNWITDQTLDILSVKPTNIPWFLQVNYAGPHDPFLVTTKMNKTLNGRKFPDTINYTAHYGLTPKRLNNDKAREQYSLEIENLDKQISIIINKLYELNEYKQTIICISSDHGDMLGDDDNFGKFKPWIQSTNVPLICSGPNIEKNKIINTYVSLIDLAATFLDYSQTKIPNNMDSISLRPFLNGEWNDNNHKYKNYVLSGLNKWRLIIKQINHSVTWKYICCDTDCTEPRYREFYNTTSGRAELLYNIKTDIFEQYNLANKYPDIVEELRSSLPNGFCQKNLKFSKFKTPKSLFKDKLPRYGGPTRKRKI